MMNNINGLTVPREMLLKILELLGPKELKNAVLVCKLWRELGEDPRLWTWTVVRIGRLKDLQKVNIQRLRMLQEIEITHERYHCCISKLECIWLHESQVNELFKVIHKVSTVKRISGLNACKGVSRVDPQLLVSVLNRLEEILLWIYLTREQMELLFSTMAENTSVKALDLFDQHQVSLINPVLFASGLSSVVELSIFEDEVTSEQMTALLTAISSEDRPLRSLKVCTRLTCDIDPALLGLALNRLEEVKTYGPWISAAQITAIISDLVQGKSRLRRLMVDILDDAAVEELDSDLVQRAKKKVGKFFLVGNEEEDDD